MARTTQYYGYNISEGTDLVNPLVDIFPNWDQLDGDLKDVSDAAVGTATELTTGTVHALTRSDTDRNVFIFVATSAFEAGETFTLDGVQVTALTPDGQPLATGSYIIGSIVLCAVSGTLLTVYVNPAKAKDADKLDGHSSSYFATDADLDALDNTVSNISTKVGTAVLQTTAPDLSGAVNELNTQLTTKVGVYATTVTSNASGLLSIPFEANPQTVLMNVIPLNSGNAYIARLNYNTQDQVINAILTDYAGTNIPNGTVSVAVVYGKNPFNS